MRAPAVVATAALWAAFVAALQVDGTWQRLGEDLPGLSAFACAVAVLVYVLDAEARGVVDRLSASVLLVAALVSIALAFAAPRAVGLLIGFPLLGVAALGALTRAMACVMVTHGLSRDS